ncbi:peptidoglycan-associated lipoprotein Pal [Orrella sp. 11846]|uniref:peptidoglycan-associated lipoprotein Pal n=1 Tax=Orrella sp. 11846 TaxID=3409913 RepID=UPI003B5BC1D8
MNSRLALSITAIFLGFGLAACSSVALDDAGADSSGAHGSAMDPFNPNSVLSSDRSVYFEFNKYNVDEQYRPTVENHANYLRSHPQQNIVIEGNTDAVGGSEYNLALGHRRAEAVRRVMTLMGTNDQQIETISFGKEKPRALGYSEQDHAENRRADIVYERR